MNIPATMLLILYVWLLLHSVYHHVLFLSLFSLCFLGNYQIPITNQSMFYRWFTSYFFVGCLRPGVISPYVFLFLDVILLSIGYVYFLQPFYLKTKHSFPPNVKMFLRNLFYPLTPCKIADLIVDLRVELNFLRHILYQIQMPLISLPILVFSMSWFG